MLERVTTMRTRALSDRNLPFARLTSGVIFGVVIAEVAASLRRDLSLSNYRSVLLITALLLFIEMYIVLTRYHDHLGLDYANMYMFVDLIITLLFVSFVSLMADSWDNPKRVDTSLRVLVVLFVALFIRQMIAFLDLILRSTDVQAVLNHHDRNDRLTSVKLDLIRSNAHLKSRLEEIHLNQRAIVIPMGADLIGIGYALCALLVFGLNWWAWIGLLGFLGYEVVMFVVGPVRDMGRRQLPRADVAREESQV